MSNPAPPVYHYTNPGGDPERSTAARPQSLTIVREQGGALFITAKWGGLSAFVDLPQAAKLRLYEWLKADIEGEAPEAKAKGLGLRVISAGTPAALISPAIERAAALGQSPAPVYIHGRDPGDEDVAAGA